MKSKKYRTYRVSKSSCPTHVTCNGTTGTLHIGRKDALTYIETKIGRKFDTKNLKMSDNVGQWIFKEPLADNPKPSKVARLERRAKAREALRSSQA